MKKGISILICCLLFMVFSVSAFAQSNYDFRNDRIEDTEEYDGAVAFEDEILADIYGTSSDEKTCLSAKVDFTDAVKTYNYTPQELLDNLSENTLLSTKQSNANYSWKIPVNVRSDGYDYAVIYRLPDGTLSYYTASTTSNGAEQVDYLFNQAQISEIMSQGQISDFQNLYAFTISQINMDLIVIENQSDISFIHFASRPDLLEIKNGSIYTMEEITEIINKYLSEASLGDPLSGGSPFATRNNSVKYMSVVLPVAILVLLIVLLIRYRKRNKIFREGN